MSDPDVRHMVPYFFAKVNKKANNSLDIFATGVYNGFAKLVRTAASRRVLPGHGTDT